MRFVVGALLAAVSVGIAGGARAAPLDEPFVGGLGFTGPSSPSVASIYWNPAALGAAHGTQVMISGVVRLASTTVDRAGGAGSATGSELIQPAQWPIGPGAFMGISSDLGGDRFTIGFATYMPYVQKTKYDLSVPAGTEPTRYQALDVDLRNLALVPALSIRFIDDFRLGIAPGFMFSTGRLVFDEDTYLDGLRANCGGAPCNAEDPAAAARVAVDSGNGFGNAKFSLTLGGGVYYRRRGLEVGLAYTSRPIGGDISGVEVAGERTTVTQPASGTPLSCASGRCVFGDLQYRLPDVWMAGVTWHLRSGLEITAIARWLWFHVHDRIDVRLTGPGLETANVPSHIVLYRGFRDVWDLRGRVAYWWHERVRLGAQLRFETSAVAPSAVNASAIDGLKIQPLAMVQVRVSKHFWLDAAYGITLMGDVTVNQSAFDPAEATGCNASGGDLDACAARRAGRARPTAAGTYGRLTQDFGLTMTAKF
jgi:long-subunit fatty acid transport protein